MSGWNGLGKNARNLYAGTRFVNPVSTFFSFFQRFDTTNLSFEYIEGESILMHMDIYGICASSGSACTTGSLEPSHVLRAMGVPYTAAHGAIRFSLSRYNTQEDVDAVVEVMPGIIEKIRAISPYWADFVSKR